MDFAIENGDFPYSSYVSLPEGTSSYYGHLQIYQLSFQLIHSVFKPRHIWFFLTTSKSNLLQ